MVLMTHIGFIWEWEKIFARYISYAWKIYTHQDLSCSLTFSAAYPPLFSPSFLPLSHRWFSGTVSGSVSKLSSSLFPTIYLYLMPQLRKCTRGVVLNFAPLSLCVARARLAHELNWRCAHALLRGAARAFCSPKSGNDGWMMIVNWDAITETIETITERCVGQGQRCLSIVCSIPEVDDSGRWSYSDDLWAETGSKIGGWRYRYSITYWW